MRSAEPFLLVASRPALIIQRKHAKFGLEKTTGPSRRGGFLLTFFDPKLIPGRNAQRSDKTGRDRGRKAVALYHYTAFMI